MFALHSIERARFLLLSTCKPGPIVGLPFGVALNWIANKRLIIIDFRGFDIPPQFLIFHYRNAD